MAQPKQFKCGHAGYDRNHGSPDKVPCLQCMVADAFPRVRFPGFTSGSPAQVALAADTRAAAVGRILSDDSASAAECERVSRRIAEHLDAKFWCDYSRSTVRADLDRWMCGNASDSSHDPERSNAEREMSDSMLRAQITALQAQYDAAQRSLAKQTSEIQSLRADLAIARMDRDAALRRAAQTGFSAPSTALSKRQVSYLNLALRGSAGERESAALRFAESFKDHATC